MITQSLEFHSSISVLGLGQFRLILCIIIIDKIFDRNVGKLKKLFQIDDIQYVQCTSESRIQ